MSVQPVIEQAGGAQGLTRGVFGRCWRTEHRQRGIALELVDPAAVSFDNIDDDRKELVEHSNEFIGGHPRGQAR